MIERRFRGPTESGNGGYTCGLVAAFVDGPAEVTLRLPPPLDRPLDVVRDGDAVRVLDGDTLVAEAKPADGRRRAAGAAVLRGGRAGGAARRGSREPVPGVLRLRPAPRGRRGPAHLRRALCATVAVAAHWLPAEPYTGPEFVWAALDCPGAYACGFGDRGVLVLGRLAARVEALPEAGERCVVVAWPLGDEGRKAYAGTALYGEGGRVLGVARATWIEPLGL